MNKLQDIMNNILELGTIEQTLLMVALLGVVYGVSSYLGNRASNNIEECTPYYTEK